MTVDAGHRSVEAGIRNAVNADSAVVIRDLLDQPINRVVGVAGLVDLVPFLVWDVGPHVFILAFAHVTAAHVLVNKDVALAREQLIRSQRRLVLVRAVWTNAVRRSIE